MSASIVNERYGNTGDYINPVFRTTIENLVASKLYGENLLVTNSETSEAGKAKAKALLQYESPVGSEVVALDVLVDCITKSILSALKDGFEQGGIKKDTASNINISLPSLPQINSNLVDNVHDAIWILCQEVATLKAAVNANTPIGISDPNTIKNKISLIHHV